MGITITQRGSFANSEKFLRRLKSGEYFNILMTQASIGTNALSNATPVDTGETAAAWTHDIIIRPGYASIKWKNSKVVAGRPIVIMLTYGHGTGTGGYVQGRDFIMPSIRPIFDQIAEAVWREVTR